MNSKHFLYSTFLFPILFSGCSNSLLNDMNRTIDDPLIIAPEVQSFTKEMTIQLHWDEDPGADEYILYRSNDDIGINEIVYRGNELEYTDTDLIDENRYLYSLVKMRGSEAFGPSQAVLGVASMTVEDEYEPNDNEENASPFLFDLSANVQYYASQEKQHILEDRDWYSIEVRPRMQAIFTVEVPSVMASDPTDLIFYTEPDIPQQITNDAEISIKNTSMEKKTFTFCIYPDGASIITNNNGGGKIIQYDLNFIKEQEL